MNIDQQKAFLTRCLTQAFLTRCLEAPLCSILPPPPPPPREVHPEGTCFDCGATEEDDHLSSDGFNELLCSNCHACHRPGGY